MIKQNFNEVNRIIEELVQGCAEEFRKEIWKFLEDVPTGELEETVNALCIEVTGRVSCEFTEYPSTHPHIRLSANRVKIND